MLKRTLHNISERRLLAELLCIFKPPVRMSTWEYCKKYRYIGNKETSFSTGPFDPDIAPYMEYVYECLDNPYIPIIYSMKSARITWTEVLNNYRSNRMENNPCQMVLTFATGVAKQKFGKKKMPYLLAGIPSLKKIVNIGIAKNKENMFEITVPNGSLSIISLGSIAEQKSDNYPYIENEEPDDAKDEVSGQGDTYDNLEERQKTIPPTMRKFIAGGTPTNKDFSRIEKLVKRSNWLIFKAECHSCGELVAMDHTGFAFLKCEDYEDRKIDEIYGRQDPLTAKFFCPYCEADWSFQQKNLNIRAGKKHGFIDHTGNFSKGWHPQKPNITERFGFTFSELLAPFEGSNFVKLEEKRILAEIDAAKGDESKLKSYCNNTKGIPYASGVSAMEVEDMRKLRKNYPEHICPAEGLFLFTGIDVQHNRLAIVTVAFGRRGNMYLITWKEIFGNVFNKEDSVWKDLTEYCLAPIPHAGGQQIYIDAVSIDSGDGGTTEVVYDWVRRMNNETRFAGHVRATKGARELRFSLDEIYATPREINPLDYNKVQQTLAERMGVKVYQLGAHKAHDEILRRIGLNLIPDCKSDVFFFNEQTYGGFEEQMLSCRKLLDTSKGYTKMYYQLVSGKRKEAMDACKNAIHAAYAEGIREITEERCIAVENALFKGKN